MNEQYDYTPSTFDRLTEAAVHLWEVDYVLRHSQPHIRQHLGAGLRVIARDRRDAWLVVILVEIADDHYEVFSARYLDDLEVHAVIELLGDQL